MPQMYGYEVAEVRGEFEVHASYDVPKDAEFGLAAGRKITVRIGLFDSLEEASREVQYLERHPKQVTMAGARERDLLSLAI